MLRVNGLWVHQGTAAPSFDWECFISNERQNQPQTLKDSSWQGTISPSMTPQQKAESLGIVFAPQTPGYLNLCIRSGNQLITSGHVSGLKGKLGAGLSTEQGYEAARDCATRILQSVWNAHGTLDGLRVLKVLGCVNSAPEFIEQHLVINGASDLLHEIFGKQTDGFHARSALGFASLPTGAAVEVEAIFEIK